VSYPDNLPIERVPGLLKQHIRGLLSIGCRTVGDVRQTPDAVLCRDAPNFGPARTRHLRQLLRDPVAEQAQAELCERLKAAGPEMHKALWAVQNDSGNRHLKLETLEIVLAVLAIASRAFNPSLISTV
jgi:hypothetical protein